ncbi:class I SAM-dependent methyltransferase [Flavobacterium sp. W22_SRS_FP1]|uniref:class I SAM-dependent methyltransferase n=1 Tax=Flavobacterium sp. W22_SRS_FP1 TaxID=3240276 RepID=UPI003F90B4E7
MENKQNTILSPLTKSSNVEKILEIDSNHIIQKYKKEISIDVIRFFKNYKTVSLYKCLDTGYKFYYPFTSVGDKEFYEDLSKNRKNYYSDRWEHKKALKYIGEDTSVLEIGSGFGAFLKLLRVNKIESKGLELNPLAVIKCKEEDLDVSQKLIQEEAETSKSSYDAVCSFQVLEHITEVHSFIESSVEVLKKSGKLIIGVPNNNPFLFINDKYHTLNLPPHHAGLWDENSLKSLENIFSIQLVNIEFEPLEVSYSYFIDFQINNATNVFVRKLLTLLNKRMPILLKKIICRFVKGRNVLAVFKKTY